MFCKEDLAWFKNLESYKRIELMCTLLNMCLPFELRFLGTCLEELGRKDAQDLRGFEQRVNNPQEFNNEFAQFQSGEPTDMKVRRMMAMYLALVRACNRTCVHALYKTLESWGDRDFTKISDGDPLQELLLVYTMAINHPVFSFEQRMKCGEIYSKILVCKNATVTSQTPSSSQSIFTASSTSVSPLSSSTIQSQVAVVNQHPPPASITSSPPPLANQPQSQALLQPTTIALHPQQMASQILIPSISMFPQMRPTEPTSLQIGVENLSQIPVPSNMVIQPDFSLPPPWMRPGFNHIYPPVIEGAFPPSSTSPHLSQPSSPSHSRTGSPTRNQPPTQQQPSQSQVTQQSQSQQNQSGSHRSQTRAVRANRRASSETTPPPLQSQTNISYIGNDMIVSNMKNYEELNVDGAMTQLQQLRNGYTRPTTTHHTIPRQSKSYLHQHHMMQHQQATQQQIPAFNPNAVTTQMAYSLGNMSLVENVVHQKSAGSDSGSSVGSVGDSPPDTPSLVMGNISSTTTTTTTNPAQMRAKQQLSLSNRLNKIQQGGSTLYSSPPAQNSPQQNTGNPTTNTNSNNNNNNNNNTDFSGQVTSSNNNSLNNSNNNSLVMAATTTDGVNPLMLQHQPYHPPTTTQRPQPVLPVMAPFHPAGAHVATATTAIFQVPPNGEIIFPFQAAQPVQTLFLPPPAQTTTAHSHRSSPSTQQMPPPPTQTPPMLLNSSAFPTTKKVISCFNCGSTSHTGRECHETSMEDVTRNATYKLDYSSNSNLHSLNTAPATSSFAISKQSSSSVSLSSMVSDSGMMQQQNSNSGNRDHMTNSASAPQFEPIPSTSPIIIDLTQDTSSSSSSSVSSILK